MKKIVNYLSKHYPPDALIDFDLQDEMVFLRVENPATGGKTYTIDMGDIESEIQEESKLNFEGITKVKAWEKAGKKRVYFKAVGVPDGAYRSGKVFVEYVNGRWIPNMRYKIMQDFANQLNNLDIEEPSEVQLMYEKFLEENY